VLRRAAALGCSLAVLSGCGADAPEARPEEIVSGVGAGIAGALGGTDGGQTREGAHTLRLPTAADLAGGEPIDLDGNARLDPTTRQLVGARRSELLVPPPIDAAARVVTDDGLLAHNRGARLHKAGAVTEGDQVAFSTRLVNAGPRALRVQRIEGECECVEASCYRLVGGERGEELRPGENVAPGEEFEMQVHLDTTDRTGLLQLEGILDYAGSAAPLKFAILADIRPVYLIEPESALQPKRVLLGRPFTARAHVSSPIAPRFKLALDRRSLPGHLTLDVQAIEPDADGFASSWFVDYAITAEAPDAAGLVTHPVVFEVVAAPAPGETLPVSFLRTVPVGYRTLLPVELVGGAGPTAGVPTQALDFGRLAPGANVERRLRVRVNEPGFEPAAEPSITLEGRATVGAEILPVEAVVVALEAVGEGRRELVARFTAPTGVTGPMRAQFRVDFGHPKQKPLLVTLTGMVR
jgi:hypothetical protein